MIVQFRQGIVKYNEPVMVQVNFPNVNLIASVESPLIVNIASGTHDFLHAETQNIPSAWTGLALNTHIWLYLDIDKRTAVRTFGTSFYEPVVATNPPLSPAVNQHWFDLTTSEMKVWTGTIWSPKIRIFICMLQNGVTPISLSDLSPTSFAGTQVGENVPVQTGYILFDVNNNPIFGTDNTFVTTEDKLRVASLTTSEVKVGSLVVTAISQQTVAAYSIVEFTDFGKVSPATAWTTSTQKQFGIVETSYLMGEVATISIDGIITNSNWDWTSVGVNAYLYINNTGQLTTTPIIPLQQPVAIVTDVHSIMLIPKVVISHQPPALASEAIAGSVQLSLPAVDTQYPIVVGDNDPRIGAITGKVDRAGDTITGSLIIQGTTTTNGPIVANSTVTLSANPLTNLQAATKQYVDVAVNQVVSNLVWLPPISDPDLANDTLNAPPVTTTDEVYIIGSNPTGAWFGLAGHAVRWNGSSWTDVLGRPVQTGDRFGVAVENGITGGGLVGLDHDLVEIVNATPSAITYTVTVPSQGQAVLVNGTGSRHFGHQYTFNGTVWVEILGEIPLSSLSDVTLTTPTTGQALTYNGTIWVNSTPNTALSGLTDVTLTTPVSGQALTYNGTKWVNTTLNTALSGLTDVTLTSPVSGQALTFNGVRWVNSTPNTALSGLTDVTLTSPTSGQVLEFNGTRWVNTTLNLVTAFANLSDVTLTNLTSDQLSVYDGTKWVNKTYAPTDITTYTWGAGASGQFGNGTSPVGYPVPFARTVDSYLIPTDAVIADQIGSMYQGFVKVKKDGTLWAWGFNNVGQLGQGDTLNRSSPVQIGTATDWKTPLGKGQVGTSLFAIKNNGTLWACGYNGGGVLGLGDTTNRSSPVQVGALTDWKSISCGYHTLATKTDGTLWAWGSNTNGELGDGTVAPKSSPIQIGALTNWSNVYCGFHFSVATKTDGTVWTWGSNSSGQLGLNDLIDRSSPVQVGALTNWAQIDVGKLFVMSVKTDGTLWGWGDNGSGELGNSSIISVSSPIQIGAFTNWSQVACGYNTTYGRKTDGTLWAWGDNADSEIGDGTTVSKSSPVQIGALTNWTNIVATTTTVIAYTKSDSLSQVPPTPVYGTLTDVVVDLATYGFGAPTNTTVQGVKTISFTTGNLGIAFGGTGSTTQSGAFTNLAPSQTGNAGKFLTTNGTTASWGTVTASGGGGLPPSNSVPRQVLVVDDTRTPNWVSSIPISPQYSIWGSGLNTNGQLGANDRTNRSSPIQIGSLTNWTHAASGSGWNTMIKEDGTMWACGYNTSGQLGDGTNVSKSSPVQIGSFSTWKYVSAGNSHHHAIMIDGTLWATGLNSNGQLGDGTTTSKFSPVQIGTGTNWNAVAAGLSTTYGIQSDGSLWAWGSNGNFQFGDGTSNSTSSPIQIGSLTDWKQIAGGRLHAAAVKKNGTLWTWGTNTAGCLAQGDNVSRSSPTQVGTLQTWRQVSCGYSHTAMIKSDGTLWTCGYNSSGQLGDGTVVSKSSPIQVGVLTNWKYVVCPLNHTVAIKTDGTIWAWGQNTTGQLGDGTIVNKSSPVQIGALTYWTQLFGGGATSSWIGVQASVTGASSSTTPNSIVVRDSSGNISGNNIPNITSPIGKNSRVVFSDGTQTFWQNPNPNGVWMCGYDGSGVLGQGVVASKSSPVQVGTQSFWTDASVGNKHAGRIKTDGTLWMWGDNYYGQLGDSTNTNHSSPVQIGTLTDWNRIFCGYRRTFALKNNGQLWGWGDAYHGFELGTSSAGTTVPILISSVTSWNLIASSHYHSMGLRSDGTLWAWGYDGYARGVLGLGDIVSRSSPTQVGKLTNWVSVDTGDTFTAAVRTDGTLWTWGADAYTNGALGDGTSGTKRSSPVQVGALTNWKQVACGNGFAIALKTDGTIWSWGSNASGQLGSGTVTKRSSPVQIGALTNWTYVQAKTISAGAIKSDGTVWVWGDNAGGQLCQGDVVPRSSPVQIGSLTNWKSIQHGNNMVMLLNNANISASSVYTPSITGTATTGGTLAIAASTSDTTGTVSINSATTVTGNLSLGTAGNGFRIKEGTNARMGTAVLSAGSVVVANTSVTATSRIFLTHQIDGGTPGWLRISARTAGTSFTITSSSGTDTSTVAWLIVEGF